MTIKKQTRTRLLFPDIAIFYIRARESKNVLYIL